MADQDTSQDTSTQTEPPAALPLKAKVPSARPAELHPGEILRPTREAHTVASPGNPDNNKLIVGREIELSGNISACERMVVEGKVEAELKDCREIEIASTGTFKGVAAIDVAEISGNFDGTLTARDILIVRASGRVTGTVRFGKLEIERGGEIIGDIGLCGDPDGD